MLQSEVIVIGSGLGGLACGTIMAKNGALYGFAKDYRNPLKTTLSPRTKIPNLLLTGQNINMHGVLGVTLSAVVTCGQVLGMDTLVEKIRNA